MLKMITFAIVFGIMMFIWSFVFLNKSHDQVNQSFLAFLSVILLWMVLSVCVGYEDQSVFALVLKTVYWYSMLNMSLFFLHFTYRLTRRPLDKLFFVAVIINTLTLLSRYIFPIDYANQTFWRLSTPIVAPAMSAIFSLPVIYALYLIVRQYRSTQEARQKSQLLAVFWGAGLACLLSVVSEFLLPAVFHLNTQLYLMFYAILIFVVFIFVSIMKYRLLNIQSEYIFRKLFLNSSDGTIIVNRNSRIVSVNNRARELLKDENLESGDKITDYLKEYTYETNYKQYEIVIPSEDHETSLSVTQYPIDTSDQDSAKLLIITDITVIKQTLQHEKELLIEKSTIDPLTGLYNRQYLAEQYGDMFSGARENAFSLLFMDVDNFKAINEQYGHLVGDEVLKALASCIRSDLRSDTLTIRFGGDEFIVILENTSWEDAFAIAERIRSCVHGYDFSSFGLQTPVTLSIGLIEGCASMNELIAKADMAMYHSKNKGKNATTVFREEDNDIVFHMKL